LQPELSAVLSASLRIELLRQIDGLNSNDEAALWAQRRLVAKNQLSAADARQVEEAFAAKVAVIPPESEKADDVTTALNQNLVEKTPQINKSEASDEFTVPLCRTHHREVHRCGEEGSWWQKTAIDPLAQNADDEDPTDADRKSGRLFDDMPDMGRGHESGVVRANSMAGNAPTTQSESYRCGQRCC
jgi:hypothetical protein